MQTEAGSSQRYLKKQKIRVSEAGGAHKWLRTSADLGVPKDPRPGSQTPPCKNQQKLSLAFSAPSTPHGRSQNFSFTMTVKRLHHTASNTQSCGRRRIPQEVFHQATSVQRVSWAAARPVTAAPQSCDGTLPSAPSPCYKGSVWLTRPQYQCTHSS